MQTLRTVLLLTLVLGAGSAAEGLIRELGKSREWRVVGLLDDAARKQGRDIHGVPVLGRLEDVGSIARKLEASHAVVAMPGASHGDRRRAAELCTAAGLTVLTVPAFEDLVSGRVALSSLRKIELDDLLGRDPVKLDESGLSQLIRDRTVLVTGAGGSIGSELARQVLRFAPQKLLLLEKASGARLALLTLPRADDWLQQGAASAVPRNLELDDLLGRAAVQLDVRGLSDLLAGQCVLVTGAGGSIGSELARQVLRFAPLKLILLDHGELALYQIEQEFAGQGAPCEFIIGDVKDAALMEAVMAAHRPALVLHAAAYKHVPLMENANAWAAVKNNVLGTLVTARAAQAHGVEKFVMVSTDKAVNPTNVMGASKRVAEQVCQALQDGATRFVSVRFGNVLGSSGSVIPKFRAQIEAGGPVTVTHPEITRYFMSIPEACQLVLQAGLMGEGGEIFVLDMGEPVKIADLARQMIVLSGNTEEEIPIRYTGLRPGEKLYEELLADAESTLPTPHPKLRIARARPVDAGLLDWLSAWLAVPEPRTEADVKATLRRWVPEYRAPEAGAAGLREERSQA